MEDETKKEQEYAFIKEKIKDKPINKRRVLARMVWVVISALIFGLLSCFVFVIMKPKIEAWIYPEDDPTITLPLDPELEDEKESEPEKEEEPVTVESETVYEKVSLEIDDYQDLQNKLYSIGKKANKSIVTITAVSNNKDWFASPYESDPASGVIVHQNEKELLILTEKKMIAEAKEINITFINGETVKATLKSSDGNTGIAIVSVNMSEITEDTFEKVEVAVLGNSLTVNQGTVVIAIGSPLGTNYSILDGIITSAGNTVATVDSTYKILTTDIPRSTSTKSSGAGVLINMSGEVVGLIMQSYNSEAAQNTITAFSISELKGMMADLFNGKVIPYLGLKVSTVNDEMAAKYNVPEGVYIREVEMDSPAMRASINEADVIVAMDGEEIKTAEQYTQKLFELKPEQEVKIKVLRQVGEEYIEQEFTAAVGVHP